MYSMSLVLGAQAVLDMGHAGRVVFACQWDLHSPMHTQGRAPPSFHPVMTRPSIFRYIHPSYEPIHPSYVCTTTTSWCSRHHGNIYSWAQSCLSSGAGNISPVAAYGHVLFLQQKLYRHFEFIVQTLSQHGYYILSVVASQYCFVFYWRITNFKLSPDPGFTHAQKEKTSGEVSQKL